MRGCRCALQISWRTVQLVAAGFLLPPRGRSLCGQWGRVFLRLRILPQRSGDCRGIHGAGFLWGGMLFAGQELIKPFGMDFGAKKIGFGENAAEEAGASLDAGYGVFVEGAAQ